MPRKKKTKKRNVLTELEMMKFEINDESNKRRKLELELLNVQRRILEQQKIIIEKDIMLLDSKKLVLQSNHRIEKMEHFKFYEELCKNLELEKGFGFNSDTGEIIEKS